MIYLRCPIHFDHIKSDQQPIALPCGHIFCTPCIDRLYGDTRTKPCPLCNKPTKKTSFVKLYAFESSHYPAGSPTGSPTGTHTKHEHAASIRSNIPFFQTAEGGRRVKDALNGLCSIAASDGGSSMNKIAFNAAVDAMRRMAIFLETTATGTTDIDVEFQCLAQELKDAFFRFQSLLFPRIETLLDLRQTIETLKSQNEDLESKLARRKWELETVSQKRVQQDKEKSNLLMAKILVDGRVAGLEKALDAIHETLRTAEKELVIQKGLVGARDEELAKYKLWLRRHKQKAERYKSEMNRLKEFLELEKRPLASVSLAKPQLTQWPSHSPSRMQSKQLVGEDNVMIIDLNKNGFLKNDGQMDDLHLKKERRVDDYRFLGSSDISNFTTSPTMFGRWKPAPIMKVANQESRSRTKPTNLDDPVWDVLPLRLNSKGQAKKNPCIW